MSEKQVEILPSKENGQRHVQANQEAFCKKMAIVYMKSQLGRKGSEKMEKGRASDEYKRSMTRAGTGGFDEVRS